MIFQLSVCTRCGGPLPLLRLLLSRISGYQRNRLPLAYAPFAYVHALTTREWQYLASVRVTVCDPRTRAHTYTGILHLRAILQISLFGAFFRAAAGTMALASHRIIVDSETSWSPHVLHRGNLPRNIVT